MERIRRGLARFGGRPPFVTLTRSDVYGPLGWPVDGPVGTLTTRHDQALVSGCQVVAAGNTFERDGSTCRTRALSDPSWAIHTTPAFGLAFRVDGPPAAADGPGGGGRPVPPTHDPDRRSPVRRRPRPPSRSPAWRCGR